MSFHSNETKCNATHVIIHFFKGTIHPKIKNTYFFSLACSAIYPSRLFCVSCRVLEISAVEMSLSSLPRNRDPVSPPHFKQQNMGDFYCGGFIGFDT